MFSWSLPHWPPSSYELLFTDSFLRRLPSRSRSWRQGRPSSSRSSSLLWTRRPRCCAPSCVLFSPAPHPELATAPTLESLTIRAQTLKQMMMLRKAQMRTQTLALAHWKRHARPGDPVTMPLGDQAVCGYANRAAVGKDQAVSCLFVATQRSLTLINRGFHHCSQL